VRSPLGRPERQLELVEPVLMPWLKPMR